MRDGLTTALEVTGMLSLCVALALLTDAWAGFTAAGVLLLLVGVLEGRKS